MESGNISNCCSYCGKQMEDDARFCPSCGRSPKQSPQIRSSWPAAARLSPVRIPPRPQPSGGQVTPGASVAASASGIPAMPEASQPAPVQGNQGTTGKQAPSVWQRVLDIVFIFLLFILPALVVVFCLYFFTNSVIMWSSIIIGGILVDGILIRWQENKKDRFKGINTQFNKHKETAALVLLILFFLSLIICVVLSIRSNFVAVVYLGAVTVIFAVLSAGSIADKFPHGSSIAKGALILIAGFWFLIFSSWKSLPRLWNAVSIALFVGLLLFNQLPQSTYAKDYCFQHTDPQWLCGNPLAPPKPLQDLTNQQALGADEKDLAIGITDGSDPYVFDGLDLNETTVIRDIGNLNAQVKASGRPYIDLVEVTFLSQTYNDLNGSVSIGIEDLRGAYLAVANYDHPKGHQRPGIAVRLLIANIGVQATIPTTVPIIMDQLLHLYRQDTHLYGILGLPFSASDDQATAPRQTNDWYKYGSPLPIISPSATSEKLTGRTNFYRISSPDHVQVCDMLQEIATSLGPAYDPGYEHDPAHRQLNLAVFYDPKDAYSTSLYTDLTGMVNSSTDPIKTCLAFSDLHYHINLIRVPTTISNSGNYLPAIKYALGFTPDMIYFAGYSFDLNAFKTQLQQAQSTQYSAYPIPIVGGDGLYSVDRVVTNTTYRVYATTYASPVPLSNSSNSQSYEALQALLHSYNRQFPNIQGGQGTDTIPLLPAHAILSYDAADAFICALGTNTLPDQQCNSGSPSPAGQLLSRSNFQMNLSNVSFNGASGLIMYANGKGDPDGKSVYVMCEDQNYKIQEAATYQANGTPTQFLKGSQLINCTV